MNVLFTKKCGANGRVISKITASDMCGAKIMLAIDAEDLFKRDGQLLMDQLLGNFVAYAVRKNPDYEDLKQQLESDALETF